jgi:hypothetical protein
MDIEHKEHGTLGEEEQAHPSYARGGVWVDPRCMCVLQLKRSRNALDVRCAIYNIRPQQQQQQRDAHFNTRSGILPIWQSDLIVDFEGTRGNFYFPNIHKRFYRPFSSTSFLQVSPSTFFELLIIDCIGRHDTNRFNW